MNPSELTQPGIPQLWAGWLPGNSIDAGVESGVMLTQGWQYGSAGACDQLDQLELHRWNTQMEGKSQHPKLSFHLHTGAEGGREERTHHPARDRPN